MISNSFTDYQLDYQCPDVRVTFGCTGIFYPDLILCNEYICEGMYSATMSPICLESMSVMHVKFYANFKEMEIILICFT